MFKKVDPRQSLPKLEEEVLKYWDEHKTFEKSVENRKDAPQYVFYDGPPFATGTPHYGHLVASTLKDAVPRYWTMRGYRVERKWGWDCHGLPIENIAEKELGVKQKKDIEEMGVDKFNEFCRSKVLQYVDDWKAVIRRLGRWADMENSYKTMDLDYMESVWWVFKQLWDKGLIYESYRIMHVCTRCETTLSQQEVSEGYMDIKDLAVTAKFELADEPGTFVLAWTTTPWTLPGNVALAVGRDIKYILLEDQESKEKIITGNTDRLLFNVFGTEKHPLDGGKNSIEWIHEGGNKYISYQGRLYKYIKDIAGEELLHKSYKPPFDSYIQNRDLEDYENGWKIVHADFVTTDMGTGIAHEAPAFGEDDWNLAQKEKLPFVQHVRLDGTIKDEVKELAGLSVKPKDDHQKTDVEVIKYLAGKGLLFSKEKYEHSYPHCWRCDTPLINYATSSWFVKVTAVKERAVDLAKEINWSPEHVKAGRFGKWLEGARDWSISRQRFWASVMPVWKCDRCAETKVFGSVKELEEASGRKIEDIHKHVVDNIVLTCTSCEGEMRRIPDVLDTWFDSGSMPYAQMHYPFENKEKFEKNFPAEFIAEGIDQTRAWFYYLHVLGTAVMDRPAYKNVVVNGIVLAEDGKKMSKRLQNYPDPSSMFDKYGADAMRLYLLSSPVVSAENLNFSEKEMSELMRNVFRMLWNSYSFFTMYAAIDGWSPSSKASAYQGKPFENPTASENILDRWILSELQVLVRDVNANMEAYDIMRAARSFAPFIDNLSNWYIRRSRKRFWKNENDGDKNAAYQTLHTVLVTLARLMAPFTPFIAEEIYRNLMGFACHPELVPGSERGGDSSEMPKQVRHDNVAESVHLADFPTVDESLIDEKLNADMGMTRNLITEGLQLRAQEKIKVRQPLLRAYLLVDLGEEFRKIMEDELNVKEVLWDVETSRNMEGNMRMDFTITEELKLEGKAREIIRFIQELRKEAGYDVENRIAVGYQGAEEVFEKFGEMIAKEVLAEGGLKPGELEGADIQKEVTVDGMKISLWLKR
jgi:isoleucyl-tRNA synthetase